VDVPGYLSHLSERLVEGRGGLAVINCRHVCLKLCSLRKFVFYHFLKQGSICMLSLSLQGWCSFFELQLMSGSCHDSSFVDCDPSN
jgi:hypothetical protein